jgi:protein-S-isoprenylcysteine O-methyltransferase Ste14
MGARVQQRVQERVWRIEERVDQAAKAIGYGIVVVIGAVAAIGVVCWLFSSVASSAPPWAIAIIVLLVLIWSG